VIRTSAAQGCRALARSEARGTPPRAYPRRGLRGGPGGREAARRREARRASQAEAGSRLPRRPRPGGLPGGDLGYGRGAPLGNSLDTMDTAAIVQGSLAKERQTILGCGAWLSGALCAPPARPFAHQSSIQIRAARAARARGAGPDRRPRGRTRLRAVAGRPDRPRARGEGGMVDGRDSTRGARGRRSEMHLRACRRRAEGEGGSSNCARSNG
jgi:hypothetical protein